MTLDARKPKPLVCIMENHEVMQEVSLEAETTERKEEEGEGGGRPEAGRDGGGPVLQEDLS